MPYTIKAVTTCADQTIPVVEQIAKIAELYKSDFSAPAFDIAPVLTLRQKMVSSGSLLARGSIISADGRSIQTTAVWKSQAAYIAFKSNPTMADYLTEMQAAGWNTVFTAV